jgi:putative holliday junction resolvase
MSLPLPPTPPLPSSLAPLHAGSPAPLHPVLVLWSNDSMDAGKRILAVDYGEKNIGLACSDELGFTVQPLPSIPNAGRGSFVKKVRAIINELGVGKLVLGMPIKMDGTRGDSAIRMEELLEFLKKSLKIPASGMDERLSTLEAMELWGKMSPRRQKRYRSVDSLAAALILERYMREK